jgi:hypothetical protein
MEDLLLICAPIGVLVYAAVCPGQFSSFLYWAAGLFQ